VVVVIMFVEDFTMLAAAGSAIGSASATRKGNVMKNVTAATYNATEIMGCHQPAAPARNKPTTLLQEQAPAEGPVVGCSRYQNITGSTDNDSNNECIKITADKQCWY
jgi:hypothetical protein